MRELNEALSYIRSQTDFVPKVGLILGSGLGAFADNVRIVCRIPYASIPYYPDCTVQGHCGQMLFGYLAGMPVAVLQGRVHYYEGYSMTQVVTPVRLLRLLGAEALILTNAAGGIRKDLRPGDLMLLRDHIACFVPSPLRGANSDVLGERFPDMSAVYDPVLCDMMRQAAESCGVDLKDGVYLQTAGPQYETPQEIRMFASLGAHAVGMSTACEAIAAVHCGMRVCALSCITNMAAGLGSEALSHKEVQTVGADAAPKLQKLLLQFVSDLANIL